MPTGGMQADISRAGASRGHGIEQFKAAIAAIHSECTHGAQFLFTNSIGFIG